MKYVVVLLVTICIIGSVTSDPHSGYGSAPVQYQSAPAQYQSAPAQYQSAPAGNPFSPILNPILNSVVTAVISNVVQLIGKLVVLITPANATVSVPILVAAVKALGNPSLGILLAAVLALVFVDGLPVLKVVPPGLLALKINGANLLQFLISSIPAGATKLPFALVAQLLESYLIQLLSALVSQ